MCSALLVMIYIPCTQKWAAGHTVPAVTDAIAGLYKNKYHIWRGDKQNPHVDVVGEVLQKLNDIYGGGIHRSHTNMYFAKTLFLVSYHTFLQFNRSICYNKTRYLGYRNVKEGFDEVF